MYETYTGCYIILLKYRSRNNNTFQNHFCYLFFQAVRTKFLFFGLLGIAKDVIRKRKLFLSSKYHLLYVISYHPMNLIRENTSKRPFFEMGILSLAFFLFITSSNKKTTLTSCKHCEMCSGTLKVFYILYLSGNKFHVL